MNAPDSNPCCNPLDRIRAATDRANAAVAWLVTTQVTVSIERWTEGRLGAGDRVVLRQTVLPKRFPVVELGLRATHNSGGAYQEGDVRVYDITPAYASDACGVSGGFTAAQLDPRGAGALPIPNNDIEVLYRLTGDISGVFTFVDLNTNDPLAWWMTLRNTRLSP